MTLPRNEGDDLWDAVFTAPEDDAPRRALASFLRARSDPAARARGEFIDMQLAPPERREDPRARRREHALLQKWHRAWLGALASVVAHEGMVFERGFLDSGVIDGYPIPVGDPLWSTVRAVEVQRFTDPTFLAHPVMRSLRRVKNLHLPALLRLAVLDHPMTVESIEGIARSFMGEGGYSAEAEEVLAESPSLPSLRSLRLWILSGRCPSSSLLGGELGRRLETLSLRIGGYAIPLAPFLRVVRERELPLARLDLDFSWLEATVDRGVDGRLSCLAVRVEPKWLQELDRFLTDLHDGDLRRARMYTGGKLTPAQCKELRSELRARFPSSTIDFV